MVKKIAAISIILVLACGLAFAHQPRIAFGSRHPREKPIIVEKPEISKAYYGELKGAADHYRIESDRPFRLYLNILAPDEEGARTDTNVDVFLDGRMLFTLGGGREAWKSFYEKFADDDYLRGPEHREGVGAGAYDIVVYNSDNMGKYALAVGDIESFPLDETVKTAFTLPAIKKHFFNKPAISAFLNLVGLFIFIELLIVSVIIIAIAYFLKHLIRLF